MHAGIYLLPILFWGLFAISRNIFKCLRPFYTHLLPKQTSLHIFEKDLWKFVYYSLTTIYLITFIHNDYIPPELLGSGSSYNAKNFPYSPAFSEIVLYAFISGFAVYEIFDLLWSKKTTRFRSHAGASHLLYLSDRYFVFI